MAKTSKKTTKTNKKNKLHLKKSARWTIAGLMLATAVIIALIPVQNGGVSAKASSYTIPTADDLADSHGITSAKVTAPTASIEPGFPLLSETPLDIDNGVEKYFIIDTTGMPAGGTAPIPVFNLVNNGTKYDYLSKYTGSGSTPYNPPEGAINLGNNVGINLGKGRQIVDNTGGTDLNRKTYIYGDSECFDEPDFNPAYSPIKPGKYTVVKAVSYTHLTLPTICSV